MINKRFTYSYKLLLLSVFFLLFFCGELSAQWVKVNNIPNGYDETMYLDVFFLPANPDYGWVCGYEGHILRTSDRGRTWNGTALGGNYQLESIHFVNTKVGFLVAASSGVFKSTDGGVTWNKISIDGLRVNDFWGIHFYDDKVGVLLGGESCSGTGGTSGQLLFCKTTDGGNTWNVNAFYPGEYTKPADPLVLDANGGGYAVSSGIIWKTDDALTWRIYDYTGGFDWHEEITYDDGSFCIPYSEGCTGTFTGEGGIRMKTKQHDWIDFNTNHPMYGSFLLSSQEAWACGSEAAMYYTSDGGKNWTDRSCGLHTGASLDDIWFIDDTTGWVVGNGIFKFTPRDTVPPSIFPDTAICANLTHKIWVEGSPDIIYWYSGDVMFASSIDTVEVQAGEVVKAYVEYWDRPFCGFTDTFSLKIHEIPKPTILGGDTLTLCKNDSLILHCQEEYTEYHWDTGERDQDIQVKRPGVYSLAVIDSNGCQNATSIVVEYPPDADVTLLAGDLDVCIKEAVAITLAGDFDTFTWHYIDTLSNDSPLDEISSTLSATKAGHYYATYTDIYGCDGITDSLFLNVRIDSNSFTYKFETSEQEEPFDDTAYPKLTCRYLTIQNITENEQELTAAYFKQNIEFSIPQKQLPIIIEPWGSAKLQVCFTAYDLQTRRDTLVLLDNCFNHYIPMRTESLGNEYTGQSNCDVWLDFETSEIDKSFVAFFDRPYPNPNNSMFTINAVGTIEAVNNSDIRMYDLDGRAVVFSKKIVRAGDNSAVVEINHNLNTGTYIIVIQSNNKQYTYQLRVEK